MVQFNLPFLVHNFFFSHISIHSFRIENSFSVKIVGYFQKPDCGRHINVIRNHLCPDSTTYMCDNTINNAFSVVTVFSESVISV